jgi:hypothetical protein
MTATNIYRRSQMLLRIYQKYVKESLHGFGSENNVGLAVMRYSRIRPMTNDGETGQSVSEIEIHLVKSMR